MERITVFDGEFWAHKNFPPVKDDTVDEFVDCVKELAARLAAYEETGLEPEEIERILDSYGRGMTLRTENAQRLEIIKEIPIDRLRELAQAYRLLGNTVYEPNKRGVISTYKVISVHFSDGGIFVNPSTLVSLVSPFLRTDAGFPGANPHGTAYTRSQAAFLLFLHPI